ncbi:MAG: KpsF/GutQ family sugar-phosphate isomerase [Lachnospiraceae bacterium]|jgi:arabinose-5-phosphate isomerase|nr:KpsF/GutQ family sugar-phosphate isomerase [Lachnospiraceae bacterium]
MDKLAEARRVFDIEIEALEKTRDALDDTFVQILDMVAACRGKVILTGMGKPGHIAKKLAATFASLGTSAFFLHPAEALHGDLGMISERDIVIAISYSGESEEITHILPNIKMIGAKIIAISGNKDSTLVKNSDIAQILPKFSEACYLGLAPTSSTTAVLVYGDALAVAASSVYGFKDTDFGMYHPAGSLGKKLLVKVSDLMKSGEDNAMISPNAALKEAVVELSRKALGIVVIAGDDQRIQGVITDGDLRRQLEKGVDIYSMHVDDVMSRNPIVISQHKLAAEALQIMKKKNVSCLPVVGEKNECVGIIRLQSILNHGIL